MVLDIIIILRADRSPCVEFRETIFERSARSHEIIPMEHPVSKSSGNLLIRSILKVMVKPDIISSLFSHERQSAGDGPLVGHSLPLLVGKVVAMSFENRSDIPCNRPTLIKRGFWF